MMFAHILNTSVEFEILSEVSLIIYDEPIIKFASFILKLSFGVTILSIINAGELHVEYSETELIALGFPLNLATVIFILLAVAVKLYQAIDEGGIVPIPHAGLPLKSCALLQVFCAVILQ